MQLEPLGTCQLHVFAAEVSENLSKGCAAGCLTHSAFWRKPSFTLWHVFSFACVLRCILLPTSASAYRSGVQYSAPETCRARSSKQRRKVLLAGLSTDYPNNRDRAVSEPTTSRNRSTRG